MRAVVITVSTRAAEGVYEDRAGPLVEDRLVSDGFDVERQVVPDGTQIVADALRRACTAADLVLTCGGTGITPTDLTPEATRIVVEQEIPGMAEAMRAASVGVTPTAMLSRGVVGVAGGALVANLPGSPKGAVENLDVIRPVLTHALEQIRGGDHPRADSR